MVKYKCLPHYELTRNGKTISFDIDGFYETNVKSQIDLLDGCKPFIKRVDKPNPAPKKAESKPKTTAKKPTSKSAQTKKK